MSANRPDTRDRSQIPERFLWDLSHIYPDWESWESDLQRLQERMDAYQEFRGTLARGADRVLAANLLSDELGQLAYRVYQYPGLMSSEDTRDNQIQARLERVRIALAKFRQATAWYAPELLAIPEETMQAWLEETEGLAPYRFPITESYRKQRHVLDEAGERLMAFAGPFGSTPSQTYTMMADADVSFPEVELSTGERVVASHANYTNALHTVRAQQDRETMFRGYYSVFDERPNSYAAIYHGVLQRDWFIAQARNYASTLEAELDEDNIPVEVVETLIDTARAGSEPLRRYHGIRKRVLGLERYHYFDAYLPLVDVDWLMPYDEVRPLLVDSVAVFGSDYQATVERSFAERWIDVYENEGKRTGAFSAGVYGVHPYMLLNYADTLNDAFTVAHEMGHTMHTVLSYAHQPFATSSYSIFVAEVASMVNEDLFLELLLDREQDPLRRTVLLQHAIDDIAASFYRQVMFASFELEAHRMVERGEPVTAEALQQLYVGIQEGFFGTALDDHDWHRNTWAVVPHFYGSPYYVYQYATSKAAASLVHRRISEGGDAERAGAVESYLELLAAGGNDHPVAQLARAGVDFATPEPVEALVAQMDSLVERLEKELRGLGYDTE
jgi:oligoendopeptidase F